eukprot:323822-Pleurochrysis_carterae.AAC.3
MSDGGSRYDNSMYLTVKLALMKSIMPASWSGLMWGVRERRKFHLNRLKGMRQGASKGGVQTEVRLTRKVRLQGKDARVCRSQRREAAYRNVINREERIRSPPRVRKCGGVCS